MQLAARFSDMSAGMSCHRRREAQEIKDDMEELEAEGDNDRGLLAVVFNDPVTRRQRDMLAAALMREEHDIGLLRQKFAGVGARKPCPKHDDRALRPSEYTLNVLGLRNVPVPKMMLN